MYKYRNIDCGFSVSVVKMFLWLFWRSMSIEHVHCLCTYMCRYISKLESAQSLYVAQINDLKEVVFLPTYLICRQLTLTILSCSCRFKTFSVVLIVWFVSVNSCVRFVVLCSGITSILHVGVWFGVAPCGLRSCKNRPTPFPGRMSYKATKPGSVCHILVCFLLYCCLLGPLFMYC